MYTKKLSQLVAAMPVLETRGDTSIEVKGLAYDSREIEPAFVFFALTGLHVNGHAYIDQAIARGALAIVHSEELAEYRPGICYLQVADSRAALSPAAACFYDHPSRRLTVIGVTGTEGKSTTVWLIARLLELCGHKTGFVSTVDYKVADAVLPNPKHQTTPEATTVHGKLAEMADNGMEFAVIEASSHGLSPRTARLADVSFDIAVMTNVRHEHLEFHGSWEQYRDDKANLFRKLDQNDHGKKLKGQPIGPQRFALACADDPSAAYFADATDASVLLYSTKDHPGALIQALDIEDDEKGADFLIQLDGEYCPARLNLPGVFNVENVLPAVLIAQRLELAELPEIAALLPQLTPVTGRMTRVDCGQNFEVLVDYAHTPSSFQTILPPLRERVTGKLICLFGSGGERDTAKRPQQGRIASQYCDIVILSDEDPRGEDPMRILEDMAAGCEGKTRDQNLFLIPDRAQAIAKAFSLAGPGSAVLLLGKGHENTIDYASGSLPWNEIEQAKIALQAYSKKNGSAG